MSYALGKTVFENWFLAAEADTAAYSGRIVAARDLTRRSVASANHVDLRETAASYQAAAAVREAFFGNAAMAKQQADEALNLSKGKDVVYFSTLALAVAGDHVKGLGLVDELARQFPKDTQVQFNYLPALRARLAILRRDSAKAIKELQTSTPYELGSEGSASAINVSLVPVYVRGEAFLASRHGKEAAAEFQKILDHRGIVLNSPIGALARLQLGRAFTIEGRKRTGARSRTRGFSQAKSRRPAISEYEPSLECLL